MKLLLYCTKAKNKYDRLVRDEHYGKPFYLYGAITENFESLNGKIVAECDYEVEPINRLCCCGFIFNTNTISYKELLAKSCLSSNELESYLGNKDGYAIHIKKLHIFNESKELKYAHLTKAPQNMCYGWTLEEIYQLPEVYIVISIRPEWLCKILNGEKTIEVRKKVLKEMIQNV